MSRLDEDRKKIDVIDRQIAELFEKRFEIVKDVIEYKIENRLPILNSGREAEITRKNTALIQDEDIREYFKVCMKNCCCFQRNTRSRFRKNSELNGRNMFSAFFSDFYLN